MHLKIHGLVSYVCVDVGWLCLVCIISYNTIPNIIPRKLYSIYILYNGNTSNHKRGKSRSRFWRNCKLYLVCVYVTIVWLGCIVCHIHFAHMICTKIIYTGKIDVCKVERVRG